MTKAPIAPRAKTPAQVLKAQQNIEAAAKRLAAQQARAKLAKQLRDRDTELQGSDEQVIEHYLDMVFLECAFAVAEIETVKAEAAEAAMVAEALAGPSAYHLNRFLAGRAATFERVDAFFNKSGLPRVAPPAVRTAA
jgi:hypothetical protein